MNKLLEILYPSLIWKINSLKNKIYITFDDGPTPKVTQEILDILDKYNAKATFFCLGENIKANYDIYTDILKRGHSVGNHGYKHLNGWLSDNRTYINNVFKTSQTTPSGLFRPPYGRIKRKQIQVLRNDFDIIMWSHSSNDYKTNYTPDKCFKRVTKNLTKGSIILFHDTVKAEKNVIQTLPILLEYIKNNNLTTAIL